MVVNKDMLKFSKDMGNYQGQSKILCPGYPYRVYGAYLAGFCQSSMPSLTGIVLLSALLLAITVRNTNQLHNLMWKIHPCDKLWDIFSSNDKYFIQRPGKNPLAWMERNIKGGRILNKFKEKLKGGFKKRLIAAIVAAAVIITSVNLTDIAGDSNKDVSRKNKKLNSFAEEVAELTMEDTYDGDSKYQTKRLIVTAENDSFNTFGAADAINYGNIFVLSYETEGACAEARKNLLKEDGIKSVEIDAVMEVETKKVSDKDIEKAMKISSFSDNDDKPHELLDNYDSFNVNNLEEDVENNVDAYIKEKKLQQKNDVVVAIIDSGADKSAISENRFIDSQKNFSGEGESDDITDTNGHGTQMAEIISSQTGDKIKIMPIKVANKDGKCSILSAYLGVQYALENGADVINISMNTMASAKSVILENAIREASKKGIAVSVSAGNDTDNAKFYTPSNIEEAFVISATDANTTLAGYSNFGETVDYASCGIYKESEGTSIAAANFAASAAKLKSAGVKDIEAIMNKIAGYGDAEDANSEPNFFLGRGYIGNQRVIVESEKDDKKPEAMIAGVAPAVADIRSLEGDKWKELSQEELEYYICNSSFVKVGAFLSSLSREDLKKIVNESSQLKRLLYIIKNGKKVKEILMYEYMLELYSNAIKELNTSALNAELFIPDATRAVKIGGYNSENALNFSSNATYFEAWCTGIGGIDLTKSDNPVTVAVSLVKHCDEVNIDTIKFEETLGETEAAYSGNRLFAGLYGSFNATVGAYYQSAGTETYKEVYKSDNPSDINGVAFNFFDGFNTQQSTVKSWPAELHSRTQLCKVQVNLSLLGYKLIFRKTNESGSVISSKFTQKLYGEDAYNFFKVERPICTIKTHTDATSIESIANPSITRRKGESVTFDDQTKNEFGIAVKEGYNGNSIKLTEGTTAGGLSVTGYSPILKDEDVYVYADPIIYDFNYYPGATTGMTRDDGYGDGPHTDKIAFNSNFSWRDSIFNGHYNLTYKAIPLSSESEKPTVNDGESFGIRQFERNSMEWEEGEEIYDGNTIYIDKYNPADLKEKDLTVKNNTVPDISKRVNTSVSYWNWENNRKELNQNETNKVAGNRNIYAVWDNGVYPTYHTPSMTGFSFNGWYTSRSYDKDLRGYNGSGTKIEAGTAYTPRADQTLYGRWTRNNYEVTYDYGFNGGYVSESDTTKTTAEYKYDWPVEIPMNAEKSTDDGNYTAEQKRNNQAPGVYSSKNPDGWEFLGWSECCHAKKGDTGMCSECAKEIDGVNEVSKKIYGIVDHDGQTAYKTIKKTNEDGTKEYAKDEYGRYIPTYFWNSDKAPNPEDYITDEFYMPSRPVVLYAIYRKTLKFTAVCSKGNFKDPERTKIITKTQVFYANDNNGDNKGNHSIEITIPEISPAYFGLSEEGAKDFSEWETVGWSEGTEPTDSCVYFSEDYNTTKNISKNYALYAIYKRTIGADFVSYESDKKEIEENKNYQKTETKTGTQWINASNIENKTGVDITVPHAYEYKINTENGEWSQNSWILNSLVEQYNKSTKYIQDADILKEQGKFETSTYTEEEYNKNKTKQSSSLTENDSNITIYCNETYYALYDRNIHVAYTHYEDNVRKAEQKQEVRQYAISNDQVYSRPPVVLRKIGECRDWPEPLYWSTSDTDVTKTYDNPKDSKSVVININKNLNLYAIYQRGITANFVYYENKNGSGNPPVQTSSSETKPQRGNAQDFESTKEDVEFNAPGISGVVDERKYVWRSDVWTTSATKTNDAKQEIEFNPFTIKDTTTFYAVYKTSYKANFISIKDSLQNTQTKEGNAWFNASDITKKTNPVVTAPGQEKCMINSKKWTEKGWTKSTGTTDLNGDSTPFNKDTPVTITGNTDFYGLYGTSTNMSFVDYKGTEKTTRTQVATQMVNSFDRLPTDATLTAPALNNCTLEGSSWEPVGWSPASDSFTADKNEGDDIKEKGPTTFFGIYAKSVTLNFKTYNNSNTPATQTGRIYMNSANSSNRKKASASITSNPSSTTDGWKGIGWSTSTNKGASVEASAGSTFEYDRDTTLNGLYKKDITIKYHMHDGTDHLFGDPQTTEVRINAANQNDINPATFTITNESPYRTSCQFMGVWGNDDTKNPAKKYQSGSTYAFTSDTDLYAQWNMPTINKTITIKWEDENNTNKTRPDAVWLNLYRDGTLVNKHLVSIDPSDTTLASPSSNRIIGAEGIRIDTTGTGNEFIYTYQELQRYAPDGHAYSYTIEEKPVESLVNGLEYNIVYPDGQSGNIIKNILANGDGIQMDMELNWDDGLNAWHIRPSMVYASLIQTDPDTHQEKVVKTASIKPTGEAETQLYSFKNVEVMNGSSHLYIYRVKLNPIAGYSTTYDPMENRDGVATFPVYNVCTGLPTLYGENYIIFSADAFRSDGGVATGKDYLNIDATDYEPVLITLRQVKKTWNGTGADAAESYDNNTYMYNAVNGTNVSYNAIVSPHVDTKMVRIPYGRYELDLHEHPLFDLKNFSAASSELANSKLETINGKQYVTFSAKHSSCAIAKLHANLLISNWRGYTTMQRRYQPLDHTVVLARMPGLYDNLGFMTKTWSLMKYDGDIIVNGVNFKMKDGIKLNGEFLMDEKIQVLETGALAGQTDLIRLTLPNNLKTVNGEAFKNCSRLRIVTYLGVQYTTNDALKKAFERNGVTCPDSAFEGVALGY